VGVLNSHHVLPGPRTRVRTPLSGFRNTVKKLFLFSTLLLLWRVLSALTIAWPAYAGQATPLREAPLKHYIDKVPLFQYDVENFFSASPSQGKADWS
jgi:hypothetical protein